MPQQIKMRLSVVLSCGLALFGACAPAAPPATDSKHVPDPLALISIRARTSGPVDTPAEPARTEQHAPTFVAELTKELDCDEAYLHPLPEKTFLSCGQILMTLEAGELVVDTSYQRGIEPEQPAFLWQIASIAGSWPGAAWVGTNRSTVSAARGFIHRWNGQRWERAKAANPDEPLSAILPWSNGRALALVEPAVGFGARFIPLGKAAFQAPRFTAPKLSHAHCRSRIRSEVTVAPAPGEVMVAGGQVCDVVRSSGQNDTVHVGIGVERFTAGEPRGTLILLDDLPELPPGPVWEVTALVAVTPVEVLLAAHSSVDAMHTVSYFARWDGKSFRSAALPFVPGIRRLWRESAEALWATDLEGQLWRGHGTSWQRIAWQPEGPADTEITRVWARGPTDVWVLTRRLSQNKSRVFHGRLE
jgi:hypothetical protein